MSRARGRYLYVSLLLVISLLALCALTAVARGATWGELGRLTLKQGTETGQVNLNNKRALGFVVDSEDGSFYVADRVDEEFRLQRFSAGGVLEASTTFATPTRTHEETEGILGKSGIELAVDPKRNRVYALVRYERREENEKEVKEEEKEEEKYQKEVKEEEKGEKATGSRLIKKPYTRTPLDAEEQSAGALYAFEYTSGKLVSGKTGSKGAEPIVDSSVFKAQGEAPKEALLNPRGIAVDPTTGDVVVVGDQDQQDNEPVEKNEAEKECRAAVQWVTVEAPKAGQLSGALARRYVDKNNALGHAVEEVHCAEDEVEYAPYSPVVTPGGKLLAQLGPHDAEGEQVWELGTAEPGTTAEEVEMNPQMLYELGSDQSLFEANVEPENATSPTMSFLPNAGNEKEGKLYLSSSLVGSEANRTVLVLHYDEEGTGAPTVDELGWVGGAGVSAAHCAVAKPATLGEPALVGAFKEAEGNGKEGVLAFTYKPVEAIDGGDEVVGVQFGPGGSTTDCPQPKVTAPEVLVNKVVVDKVELGKAAKLLSKLTNANALGVEWQFKYKPPTGSEGTETPIKAGYEYDEPLLEEHAFQHFGQYTIKELVQSDDLMGPATIEAESQIDVEPARPKVTFSPPASVRAGEEAKFEAKVVDPNEGTGGHVKYVWRFGDGGTSEGVAAVNEDHETTLTAEHAYGGPSTYAVQLEVSDEALEETSSKPVITPVEINVSESVQEEEAAAKKHQEEEATKKHQEEEAAAKKHQEEEAAAAAAKKHQEEEAAKKAQEEAAKKRQEEEAKAKAKVTPPTRAQLLAKALKLCQKQPKKKRAQCEATARKKYGPKHKRKKKHKK